MARATFQIVQREADKDRYTILDSVKASDPMAALLKWRAAQPDADTFTLVPAAGYLQASGAVIQAVAENFIGEDGAPAV